METNLRETGRRGAFTLVELMVVVVIIGLLATIVGVNVIGRIKKANVVKVKADFRGIMDAAKIFYAETGRYPESLEELKNPQSDNPMETETGSYLDENTRLVDPWGSEYIYDVQGDRIYLLSYGPDRQQGGGDDITYPEDDTGSFGGGPAAPPAGF